MRSKKKIISLEKASATLMAIILALLTAIIVFTTGSIARVVLRQSFSDAQDIEIMYQKQMKTELNRIDTYLFNLTSSNPDFNSITYQDPSRSEWYSALYGLREEFLSSSYNFNVDGLFCFIPSENQFLFASHTALSNKDAKNIFEIQKKKYQSGSVWDIVQYENSYYLVRVLFSRKQYVGAIVGVNTLLSLVSDHEPAGSARLSIVNSDGVFAENSQGNTVALDQLKPDAPPYFTEVDGVYGIIALCTLAGNVMLIRFVPVQDMLKVYEILLVLVPAMILILIAIWIGIKIMIPKYVLSPVRDITEGLENVTHGDFHQRINLDTKISEFQVMSMAYNNMVSEIHDLKINVYESKIRQQNLEMQYLKQQIAPHFMINCLNTAYQLTEIGELDLARQMLRSLSNHLRYILSSGQVVTLGEEFAMVQNYIDMSSIRYPGSIEYHSSIGDNLGNVPVVPLMVLNFVENSIKYNASLGKLLFIFTSASATSVNNEVWIHISVCDSGPGFSDKNLETLNSPMAGVNDTDTHHIGIQNAMQRTCYQFPGASFRFSNSEWRIPEKSGQEGTKKSLHGAMVEIYLPVKKEDTGS